MGFGTQSQEQGEGSSSSRLCDDLQGGFNGLAGEGDARLCNGLIVDWAAWSDSRTYGFLAEQLSDGNQVSLVHREDIRTK